MRDETRVVLVLALNTIELVEKQLIGALEIERGGGKKEIVRKLLSIRKEIHANEWRDIDKLLKNEQ